MLRLLMTMAAALMLSGCDDGFPDYRYKMTIYVGDKAFSSVRAVEQEEIRSMQSSTGHTVKRTLTGEAVIIDVNGSTYYALLTKPGDADYAMLVTGAALGPAIQTVPASDLAARSQGMTMVNGPHPLPRTLPTRQGREPLDTWPMFVTFDDPKDPKSVREVSAESIGVDKITIEMTDEDVTTGIRDRLPGFGPETGFEAWVRTLPYGNPRLGVLSGFEWTARE